MNRKHINPHIQPLCGRINDTKISGNSKVGTSFYPFTCKRSPALRRITKKTKFAQDRAAVDPAEDPPISFVYIITRALRRGACLSHSRQNSDARVRTLVEKNCQRRDICGIVLDPL